MKFEKFAVTKVYLQREDTDGRENYAFIRCRAKGKFGSYALTQVKYALDGSSFERTRLLSAREYNLYLDYQDETRHVVRLWRTTFLWKGMFYEINEYINPSPSLCFVNCQIVQV